MTIAFELISTSIRRIRLINSPRLNSPFITNCPRRSLVNSFGLCLSIIRLPWASACSQVPSSIPVWQIDVPQMLCGYFATCTWFASNEFHEVYSLHKVGYRNHISIHRQINRISCGTGKWLAWSALLTYQTSLHIEPRKNRKPDVCLTERYERAILWKAEVEKIVEHRENIKTMDILSPSFPFLASIIFQYHVPWSVAYLKVASYQIFMHI
jgi:hypothetical protein